ncbi:Stk1 family PASTA domain-containing Ser/Thr kinase [Streptomyces sp. AK02-01A]|uniref:Stk1 family PASTA domain-containing Ser/Thr kinase n=1 Tax=Streptomyces sp. AK02-01A TaxID=3028648 RepID=UPI0029ADE683|nr:Stk1 family PASTA domain-containing Ser/Thr kinase [Streptomyces sp. AK02-01A]MDX3852891.1 Stk1 family PASTA domain-containing Ser/Thr kinase [Streptomyces sp. AK02-01A]
MDTTLQDPIVGQVLDGRYRVDARIAVGGMATVYRAVDIRLDRVLALKVMHPALAADASFVERFIREAKSVARLSHPNVVAVFDQGAQGAYVYLAMEYVAGCTLRDVLRERGALQPRAALDILEPVLAALGAAHRAGFVHRDMKPENVLIGDDGRVKVADFGLVRAVGDVTSTTGSVLGTVSYLAPEQIESGASDTRVDVYACGVVLHEMLTGAKPHAGDTPAQVLYLHLNEDVPAPSAAVPGLAVELDALVAAATARNPDARPYDAVALLALAREARARLTDVQLDAVPPRARPGTGTGAENRTSVIPRPFAGRPEQTPAEPRRESPVEHTSLLETAPPDRSSPGRRTRRGALPRRGVIASIVAVLLVLGIGSGVWYINSGQFSRVPSLLGQSEREARNRLADAGLAAKVTRDFSDTFARGTVLRSDPGARARVRGDGPVTIVVSRGPEVVQVPDLTGTSLDDARRTLKETGLAAGVVRRSFDDDVAQGSVISSDPAPGREVRPDSGVALVVSKGSAIEVTDVTGESVDEATAELEEAGLQVRIASDQVDSPEEEGTVAVQSPAEGARLARGDTVTLTMSKGPRMVSVPDVTGLKTKEARSLLEGAGFQVEVDRSFPFLDDRVSEQSVEGGDEAPEGSTITIKTEGI